jgi:hypothetical protein
MKSENVSKNPLRNIYFLLLIILCASFIVYFTIMSMIAPSRKLEAIRKEFTPAQTGKKENDSKINTDADYLRMLKEKAFLQSKIIMAETDSIYLTINFADSTINLEISGVVVHAARMNSFKASSILTKGNENIISAMLSTPLTIASDLATIKKEPVMIKMAPKDTSEYKPDIMPDTSLTEPVNYIMEMTNGTRIFVYQEEDEKRVDRMTAFRFDLNDRLKHTWDALKDVAVFKVPDYQPYIKIKLPRADAKIIYRAIPKNGQIAVFL